MSRSTTLVACIAIVAMGAAAFVYQMILEPVPEPTIELHTRENDGPPPKLEIPGGKDYAFDAMRVGNKGSHTWEFKNLGQGPLNVWLEETTCSCTVASLSSEKGEKGKRVTIAPGESHPIEIEWEARQPGRFAQAAMIGTDDPDNSHISLTVHGPVNLPLEVRPSESITFPDAPATASRKETLEIVSIDQPDVKVIKVTTSKPDRIVVTSKPMTAEQLAERKMKSGYELTVEVKPGMPAGRFSEDLLIETDHPDRPSLHVAMAGNTLGPVAVVPSRVEMPSVPSGSGGSQNLALIINGDHDIHFEIASKPEQLKVDISPEPKPNAKRRYRLTVTVPPRTAPGFVDDPIVLKSDDPEIKELKIPVSVFVSNRS